jgi:hypothetical protein
MRNLSWLGLLCAAVIGCGSVTPVSNDGSGQGGSTHSGTGGSTAGTSGAAGTAGDAGTSGGAGTTGAAGTGGGAGTSGGAGASGTAGTSGHAGTSGAAGAGGMSGGTDGGTTGAAGTGAAGTGAAGTAASDGGADDCDALKVEYTAALKEAKVCNPLSRVAQCQTTASTELACPSCTTHVESTTKLDSIRARWTKAACKSGICPLIKCLTPGTGACMATDAGSGGGMCIDDRSVATTN